MIKVNLYFLNLKIIIHQDDECQEDYEIDKNIFAI